MPSNQILRRFWRSVDKTDDCWLWTGGGSEGYGALRIGSKTLRAHRISWAIHNGKIPEGMCVLHECDNRKCVNPEHLFLGTRTDNAKDRESKGRGIIIPRYGEDNGMSKLTWTEVRTIRASHPQQSVKSLKEEYGVSDVTIYGIVNNKTWKEQ